MISAMILCAGFGTRLGELTEKTPKPMLDICGKPILEYTLMHLKSFGIIDIIINLHYLPEKITGYFGDGSKYGLNITYSYENNILGTAGAVKKVENILFKYDDFLVIYGDIFTNENYNDFYSFHKANGSIATIMLHERADSNSIVEINEDKKVTLFLERPEIKITNKKQNWVNSGVYFFKKKIFEYIPKNIFIDFPRSIFPLLVEKRELSGFPLQRYRCAVDSSERYEKLKKDFAGGLVNISNR